MTFDLRKLTPHSILALSLGRDSLAAASIRRTGETLLPPPPAATFPIGADAILRDPAKAGAHLAAELAKAGMNGFRTVVCLPVAWALSTSADLPEVGEEDLRGYFELRAEREFSIPDLTLSHATYPLPDGNRRATLAAVPAKHLEAVHAFLKAAGCNPVSISLDLPGCLEREEPMLHLFCDEAALSLVISLGCSIAALRTIASEPATLGRELRITLGRLPEGVRACLKRARVCGAFDPALPGLLEKLGLAPAVDETALPGLGARETALRILSHTAVPFEFFTPEPNRWEEFFHRANTRRGRQAVAAAAAIVFLPVLLFSFRTHEEARLNREWSAMRANVAELDGIQQKIRQFRPWFEPVPQKLQALKTVVNAFPERGDLWARSVQLAPYIGRNGNGQRSAPSTTASAITINAFSQNNAAMMALQGTLSKQAGVSELQVKQLRGNNPIQFSLTFKWEPQP